MEPPSDVSDARPAEASGTGGNVAWLVGFIGAVTAALHLFSAFYPSWANWGMHHLAFLPTWTRIAVPLLMVAALLPAVQGNIVRGIERLAAWRGSRLWVIPAGLLLLGCAFWFARESAYFLGDGYLNLRGIRELGAVEHLYHQFEKEPLAGLIVWRLYRLLAAWNIPAAELLSYQLVSIAAGVAAVAGMLALARSLAAQVTARALVFLVLLTSGGTQLFFGYVENYAISYALLLLYGAASAAYMRERLPFIVPAALFAVLLAAQLGMAVAIPTLAYLAWLEGRRGRPASAGASLLASAALFVLLLWLCGYTWSVMAEIVGRGSGHLLGLLTPAGDRQPYALISVVHAMEFVNLQVLLNPFAFVMVLQTFSVRGDRRQLWRFWLLAAACTAGASLLLHWDLGMSRDWDALAVFSLAMIPASLAALERVVPDEGRRNRLMVLVASVMFLHTVPWIALNASEERAVARVQVLPDEKVWGTTAWKSFLEELAIYYRDSHRPADAARCYEEYLGIDSTNGRIWANLASAYGEAGMPERELAAYEQAARLDAAWYGVYNNLGTIYAQHERISEALAMFRKSLQLSPGQADVLNAVGALLMEYRESYAEALRYFQASLALDSASISACLNTGLCLSQMNRPAEARRYFEKFLELAPDHPRAVEVRERLRALP